MFFAAGVINERPRPRIFTTQSLASNKRFSYVLQGTYDSSMPRDELMVQALRQIDEVDTMPDYDSNFEIISKSNKS